MNDVMELEVIPGMEIQKATPLGELEVAIQKCEVEPATARQLMEAYNPIFAEVSDLMIAASEAPTVTDATQLTEMETCRNLRLALAKVRVKGDKLRESMKSEGLRRGKAIQGVYNLLEFMVKPIEERLLASEKFAERAEELRKMALSQKRIEELRPYMDASFMNIQEMPEKHYAAFLATTKAGHEAKIAAEKKVEADRVAKEKADYEEQVKLRADNERLRLEAVAKDAAAKLAADKAAKERAVIEAKAKAEREAREKLEAEAKKLVLAEAAKKAKEAADAKKAAAAPDKEKLMELAKTVRSIIPRCVSTKEAEQINIFFVEKRDELADWIELKAKHL